MIYNYLKYILIGTLLLSSHVSQAQQNISIAIISDASEFENHFLEESIKYEITALLSPRFDVDFIEIFTGGSIEKIRQEVATIYGEQKADILIGSRIVTSKWLIDQSCYPIPTIASIQLIDQMKGAKVDEDQRSNIF